MNQEKLKQGLKEVLSNLRCIDGPNEADEYIDSSIGIIKKLLDEMEMDANERAK
jgi:hypothetical protein